MHLQCPGYSKLKDFNFKNKSLYKFYILAEKTKTRKYDIQQGLISVIRKAYSVGLTVYAMLEIRHKVI